RRRRHERVDAPVDLRRLARDPQPLAAGCADPGVRRGRADLRERRRARPGALAAGRHRRGRRAAGGRRRRLRHGDGQYLQPAAAAGRGRDRMKPETPWRFRRDEIRSFRFVRCSLDHQTGEARLVYAFDDGPELVETIRFPGAPFAMDAARAQAVERALRLAHLIAGISYYKAAVPPEIRVDGYLVDPATAALLEAVYVNGLGEFAYRNGLDLRGRIRFPHVQAPDTHIP